jgi:hypothetical protein
MNKNTIKLTLSFSATSRLLAIILLFTSATALASYTDSFSYSDAIGDVGSGSLTWSSNNNVSSGTLDISSGSYAGVYEIVPGGPAVTTSADGLWYYDNQLFSNSNPVLDVAGGLLFYDSATHTEINIADHNSGPQPEYYSWASTNGVYSKTLWYTATVFALDTPLFLPLSSSTNSVPEPSVLTLLFAGLLGLSFTRHRNGKAA